MKTLTTCLCNSLRLIALLLVVQCAIAQKKQETVEPAFGDSKQLRKNQYQKAEATDTIFSYQLSKLRAYSASVNEVASLLKREVDTASLTEKLQYIRNNLTTASKGVLDNRSRLSNQRNLRSSLVLVEGIYEDLNALQKKIDASSNKIFEAQQKLYALRYDTMMRKIPDDELLAKEYFSRINQVREKAKPALEMLHKLAFGLAVYQNEISQLQIESGDVIEEMKYQQKMFSKRTLQKEVPFLYEPTGKELTLKQIASLSLEKSKFTFQVYFNQTWPERITVIIFFIILFGIGNWVIHSLNKRDQNEELIITQRWVRYPALASFFIALGFGQFFYENAPAVFIQYIWVTLVLLGTFIFKREFTTRTFWYWMFGILLLLLVCAGNLALQTNIQERLYVLSLAFVGIVLSLFFLDSKYKAIHDEIPFLKPLLVLFIVQEVLSLIFIVFGRYTLSKIMLTGGYFNLVNGVILYWMVLLLTDFVYLITEVLNKRESLTPYFNFSKIKEATRPVLRTVMVILWGIIFIKNLNLYDIIMDSANEFLSIVRTIGNFEFSYWSIILFIFIIYVSYLLSSIISYVFGTGNQKVQNNGRSKFGGMVLIIRLAILSMGFLLAIAAAGIQLDKFTIIFGALGVGIGFGLQNIVNNLISGIIIAFERPINIGDQIEVGGRLGKVMEIGIRSSKLATFEGAEVIIPNGDLLSQHLVNWTLSSNNRRVEVIIGVKYGSDLLYVKTLLEQIVNNKEGILKLPEPNILLHEFGGSSINFRILFWTGDISDWLNLKSEVMGEIDLAFKKHGIEIPYPQHDVYIKEFKRGIPKTDVSRIDNDQLNNDG